MAGRQTPYRTVIQCDVRGSLPLQMVYVVLSRIFWASRHRPHSGDCFFGKGMFLSRTKNCWIIHARDCVNPTCTHGSQTKYFTATIDIHSSPKVILTTSSFHVRTFGHSDCTPRGSTPSRRTRATAYLRQTRCGAEFLNTTWIK